MQLSCAGDFRIQLQLADVSSEIIFLCYHMTGLIKSRRYNLSFFQAKHVRTAAKLRELPSSVHASTKPNFI